MVQGLGLERWMSKQKRKRVVEQKCFLYGEGPSEKHWLQHLKNLYGKKSGSIKIDCDSGGSPKNVIAEMAKVVVFPEYPRKIVIVDTDRGVEEILKAKTYIDAKGFGIEIITSERCLEYELLKILHRPCAIKDKYNSRALKKDLGKILGDFDEENLKKIFPKELLEHERKNNPWVEAQIKAILENI